MTLDRSRIIVDVSTHQGYVDFVDMARSLEPAALVGAIQRVSYGAYVSDDVALSNIEMMARAGLRYRMLYHFTTNDHPSDQFDRIVRIIETDLDGMVPGRCLWVDIENDSSTHETLDLAKARDLLIMCFQRWPDRVGWYAPRGIATTCRDLHSIFTTCPLWLACPDGDQELESLTYGAVLTQVDQWQLSGTTRSSSVDINHPVEPSVLDTLCYLTTLPEPKGPTMILFLIYNDVHLWTGSSFVGLGGLPTTYQVLLDSGVPVIDAATTEGRTLYDRLSGSVPASTPTIDGFTINVPAQALKINVD